MTKKNLYEKYRHLYSFEEGEPQYLIDEEYFESALEEFAKYHVQEALKEALESIPCLGSSTDIASYEEVEKAVLNSYPLDLIK